MAAAGNCGLPLIKHNGPDWGRFYALRAPSTGAAHAKRPTGYGHTLF